MSPITNYKAHGLIVFGLILIMTGCSKPNSQSAVNPDNGKHAPTWFVDHRAAYLQNPDTCKECHGADIKGGISGVSCFSSSFKGMTCHAMGPSGHPAGWASPDSHGASAKAMPAATTGFSTCQTCHGSNFTGGLVQRTCLNTTGCHGATVSAPHSPAPWRDGTRTHTNTDIKNAPVCSLCHANGANSTVQPSTPAPAGTAPGCFNNTLCHATPACGTCHGIPPAGTTSPNVAGQHAIHTGLNPNIVCATCHLGAGSGTPLHLNGIVDVILDPTYNAKSGNALHNATGNTCSNVSCHGGQTTPNWLTGAINVNTQCALCHASGTAQYNSYFSGQHSTHLGSDVGAACTNCHDTAKLAAVHFNDLDTAAMTNAWNTLLGTLNYTGTGGGTFGNCTIVCHGESHSNRPWQ